MDLAISVVLTSVELSFSKANLGVGKGVGSLHLSRFVGLLLLHYFLLKFYRVYLYPRFFSPLRSLPGPQVHYSPVLTTTP